MKSLVPKQPNSYKQIFGIVVNFTHQNLFVFDSSKTGNKFHAQFILQNGGGVNMILLESLDMFIGIILAYLIIGTLVNTQHT